MIDRNVEFPNRFQLQKVPGTDDIYDIIPAPGEVIAPGDTFSKANMLPDSIPAALGLKMANPQVKDALNVLAHVGNLHVWQRVQTYADPVPEVPAGYTLGEVEENVVLASRKTTISTTGAFYYYYGDSVTVKNDGTVNAPSSDSWAEIGRDVSATTIKSGPLFVKGSSSYISSGSGHQAVDVTNEATKVFYIPSGGTLSVTVDSNAKMCYVVATKYQPVIGYPYTPAIPAGTTTDYLTSTDRNAYPDQSAEGGQDASYVLGDVVTSEVYLGRSGASNLATINVSDSISVSDDGTITQTNPQIVTIGYGGTINYEKDELTTLIAGKFLKFVGKGDIPEDMPMLDIGNLYYIPSSVTVTFKDPTNEGMEYHSIDKYQPVTGHAAIPASTTITYLGQLGGGARIEVGSYVGTGTTPTESNPMSVNTEAEIKFFWILPFCKNSSYNYIWVLYDRFMGNGSYYMTPIFVQDIERVPSGYYQENGMIQFLSNGKKTINWYSQLTSGSSFNPANFYNTSGYTYYYIVMH